MTAMTGMTAMIAMTAFEDAGFILGSYALTFIAVALVAWRFLRHARRLADQVPDDEKYWL